MFIRATGARINKANMQLDPKKRKNTAVGRILASMSGDYQQFVKAGTQLAKAKCFNIVIRPPIIDIAPDQVIGIATFSCTHRSTHSLRSTGKQC